MLKKKYLVLMGALFSKLNSEKIVDSKICDCSGLRLMRSYYAMSYFEKDAA